MFGVFFTEESSVSNYQQVMDCDTKRFNQFFHGMLQEGVYLAPAAYEAGFISAALSEQDIEQTLHAAKKVLQSLS